MSEKNLYQRISAVMSEISKISKDTSVGFGKNTYKAVSHDHVAKNIQPLLVRHGIVAIPSQEDSLIEQYEVEGKNGKSLRYETTAIVVVDFINIDKPEEKHSVKVKAHGFDSQDKSPGKAFSMAVKYALLKTFMIASGDEEEARQAQPAAPKQQVKMATDSQKTTLQNLIGMEAYNTKRVLYEQQMTAQQASIWIQAAIDKKSQAKESADNEQRSKDKESA